MTQLVPRMGGEASQLLTGLPFFAVVPATDLSLVIAALKQHVYSRGEVVYHQDDPPGSLFIVVNGTVKLNAQPTPASS